MHCFFPSICLSLYYHVISIKWPFCFQGTWNGILAGGFDEDFVLPQEALLLRLKKKICNSPPVCLFCLLVSPLCIYIPSLHQGLVILHFSGIYQVLFWLFLSYSDPFHPLNQILIDQCVTVNSPPPSPSVALYFYLPIERNSFVSFLF